MAQPQPSRGQRLRSGIETAFAQRLSPERTRRASWFERQTVGRLGWNTIAILTLVLPTLAFFLLHSTIGFLGWPLQRELWRRDVERLDAGGADPAISPRR